MIKHYIIMSSSYSDGKRIALDITEVSMLNTDKIHSIIQTIKEECGQDVPLSTHLIETDSEKWESVREYDPFFEDVEPTRTASEFATKIKKDRVLSGMDVATYILSKIRCTHLALEKLVYYAYADYLCTHSSKLFEDEIYAFRHGPVVASVYKIYKRSGYENVKPVQVYTGVKEMPAKSRILFAEDGAEKLRSIDQTIKTYGKYSAGAMVDFTHRNGSPWSRVDSHKAYTPIPDHLIKEYHYIESIT